MKGDLVLKYQVPKCECGGELYYSTEHVLRIEAKINKNGKISKKRNIQFDFGTENVMGSYFLSCRDCNNEYTYDLDVKGRIANIKNTDEIV